MTDQTSSSGFFYTIFLCFLFLCVGFLGWSLDSGINKRLTIKNTNIPTNSLQTELIVLWNQTFGGELQDTGKSIIKCSSGGYALVGWTNSSGKGDYDIFLLRIASDGSFLWNKTFGDIEEDKGFQIINCQSGGFVIVSTFTNTTVAIANSDLLVTRLADDGTVLWNQSYIGPEQSTSHWVGDLGRSIVECTNGDLVIAGATIINDYDYWLLRLDSNGNKVWNRTFDNGLTERCYTPHSLVQCQDGGFAIVGYTTLNTNHVWLLRTDPFGHELWNQTYGDDLGFQRPEGLVACADGGFGIIANTHTFGAGGSDAWVIRTDDTGNQLWNQTYGGIEDDTGSYIFTMPDNGFTIAGTTHSFDIGNGDAWLLRVDSSGNIFWNYTLGDTNGNNAAAFVYEGNDVFTVVGTTLFFEEAFSGVWVFKAKIAPISTTSPPTTTPITSPTTPALPPSTTDTPSTTTATTASSTFITACMLIVWLAIIITTSIMVNHFRKRK